MSERRQRILEEIRRRVATRLELELDEVGPDAHIRDDLEAESMDMLELVMTMEEEYGIKIPDDEILGLSTPRSIAEYLDGRGVELPAAG